MSNTLPDKELTLRLGAIELTTYNGKSLSLGDIEQIKQAFVEDGWVTPANRDKVMKMVNEMTNLANQAFVMPKKIYIKPNLKTMTSENLMTGQEWLDRFENQLKWLVSHGDGDTWMGWDCGEVRDAARRAAGLNKKGE